MKLRGKINFSKPKKIDFFTGEIELTANDLVRQLKKQGLPVLAKVLKRVSKLADEEKIKLQTKLKEL